MSNHTKAIISTMGYASLSEFIDKLTDRFTNNAMAHFSDLSTLADQYLDWLMMEHYQFSFINTRFLSIAADTAQSDPDKGITKELQHNYEEEKTHAKIYKQALLEAGTDVEQRLTFQPTATFFDIIEQLIVINPSYALGAIYATETAAIFEHTLFKRISQEILKRRAQPSKHSKLLAFHNMHLNGVEQAHKDDLGQYVNITTDPHTVMSAAIFAIEAMVDWWDALIKVRNSHEAA